LQNKKTEALNDIVSKIKPLAKAKSKH